MGSHGRSPVPDINPLRNHPIRANPHETAGPSRPVSAGKHTCSYPSGHTIVFSLPRDGPTSRAVNLHSAAFEGRTALRSTNDRHPGGFPGAKHSAFRLKHAGTTPRNMTAWSSRPDYAGLRVPSALIRACSIFMHLFMTTVKPAQRAFPAASLWARPNCIQTAPAFTAIASSTTPGMASMLLNTSTTSMWSGTDSRFG